MAWHELDEWDALGAAGESVKQALEKISIHIGQISTNAARLSVDAVARAEYSRLMWQNLDELSIAVIRGLDSVDRSRLDAQLIARVEAMRSELAKARSFAAIATEADNIAKGIQGIGAQLGGLISAAQLLWVLKDPNASSYEVGSVAMGVLGGIVAAVVFPVTMSGIVGGALTIGVGMIGGATAKFAWEKYIAPNVFNWSESNSANFRLELSRTIDRLMGVSSPNVR